MISILIGDGQSQINVARAQKGGFIRIRGWVNDSPQLIKGHLAATVDREAKYQLASCGRATFEDRTMHAQLNLLTSGSINQTRVGILYIQAVALGSQTICSRLYVEHTTKVSCCIMIEVGLIDLQLHCTAPSHSGADIVVVIIRVEGHILPVLVASATSILQM